MTEQAVDMEIPTETSTHDIKKMLVYFIERFSSYTNFGLFVMLASGANMYKKTNYECEVKNMSQN